MSADDGPGRREVAYRVFAAEFDDADFSYSESDEERAPNYVVMPTGARVNRVFVVGVLTELEAVNEEVLRARIVDPTGAFVVYAGQYQPDALAFFERTDPPTFVALTGKARTFQPEDADVVYTSVRPESVSEVDADTRDRWTVRTAEQTVERVATMADAIDRPERGEDLRAALTEAGLPEGIAAGVPRALDHYGTTETYLAAVRDLALDAARVVAGEREEVTALDVAPDEGGPTSEDLTAGEVAVPGESVDAATASPDSTPEGAERTETEADERATVGDPVGTDASAGEPSAPEPAGEPGETAETEASETGEADAPVAENVEGDRGTEQESEPEPVSGETGEAATGAADAPSAGGEQSGADLDDAPEEDAATDEMYEFDEEERQEIEENFEMDFSSGLDIPEAGEADIETPDADAPEGTERTETEADERATVGDPVGTDASAGEPSAPEPAGEPGETAETEASETDESDAPVAENVADADAGEGDLEDAVVERMQAMADGGAVDRSDLVAAVADERGADTGAVEDAIQDALMSGRCYESGDDELTPI